MGIISVYLGPVVSIVAVVPKIRQAMSGVVHPYPRTSQALSAAAPIRGSPAGIPVALEASVEI